MFFLFSGCSQLPLCVAQLVRRQFIYWMGLMFIGCYLYFPPSRNLASYWCLEHSHWCRHPRGQYSCCSVSELHPKLPCGWGWWRSASDIPEDQVVVMFCPVYSRRLNPENLWWVSRSNGAPILKELGCLTTGCRYPSSVNSRFSTGLRGTEITDNSFLGTITYFLWCFPPGIL